MRRTIALIGMVTACLFLANVTWAQQAQTPAKSTAPAAKTETAKAEKMESAKTEKAEHSAAAKQPRRAMMAHERVMLSKDEVTALQNALASAGDYKGKVDGIFGRHTRMALRKYQKDNSLKVTGRPDSETVSKLGITVAPEHMSPSATSAAAKKP